MVLMSVITDRKGKKFALEEIHRTWKEAYRLLPSYMVQLMGIEPEMQKFLIREADGSFVLDFSMPLDLVFRTIWYQLYP